MDFDPELDADTRMQTETAGNSGCGCIGMILWIAFLFFVFGVALRILKAAINFALSF